MADTPHNSLGEHAEALIADQLDKREQATIQSVVAQITTGKPLDPQLAIQKWIEIAEQRRLRAALIRRGRTENTLKARGV